MRISIDSYHFRERLGDDGAIKAISDAGFDAMDFSYYWRKNASDPLGENYIEYAKSFREKLDRAGIVCNQAHAPFEIGYGEALDDSNPKYVQLLRSIEAAAILGAEQIIVHRIGTPEGADMVEYNLGYYRGLIPTCEKSGIKVAVENLFRGTSNGLVGVFGKPEELCAIVNELGRDNFTCCLDLGHAAITGTKPQDYIMGMEDGMLGALHVQDNNFMTDEHLLPFYGKTDWKAVISALKTKNYAGDLTLEVFGWLKTLPAELLGDAAKFAAKTTDHLRTLFK